MTEPAPEHPQAPRPTTAAPHGPRPTTAAPHAPTPTPPPYGAPTPAPVLVAVAHGSRDPQAPRTVRALLDRVRDLRPGLDVRLAHLELNAPLLPDTLDGLRGADAVLVPLLLGRGHHVKRDLPAAPAVRTRIAEPLGPHPLLVEALHERLLDAGWTPADRGDPRTAVVLAAAGSRDPDSARDTRRTARLLAARLGVPVVPAYATAAAPTVPAALSALAARGRHRAFVASYFTAPGRFASACAAAVPHRAAAPLGDHPATARLVLHRYDRALSANAPADTVTLLASA
ncbi:sirohydrochlorin chelatase [Streptomyces sp. JV180]|uniref:sirohydrochlorin chelatase n=1 Tax=Streptomyces sp. JV180 TaxID=858634 RepID=UPI00168AC93D|nr:sirohydrochlorin chelatase [Streptomyces sp. JV180]MBD3545697.1 sirohydrochlorin chelatase [Streptomyces sp. JV180]